MARLLATVVALVTLAACHGKAPSATAARPAEPGSTTLDPAVLHAICTAEHVDASSTVFVAFAADGRAHRLVVTPSRRIADLGNLIFAVDGTLLGEDTGGEVPWDDQAFMATERARVAALMDGAAIPNGQQPQPCP